MELDANMIEYIKISLMGLIALIMFFNLKAIREIADLLKKSSNVKINSTEVVSQSTEHRNDISAIKKNEKRITEEDLEDEEKLVAILAAMIDASEDNENSIIKVKSIKRIA